METKLKARKSLKKGICVRCGQSYAAKSAKKKYCSENCRVQYCREKKQKKQEAYISNLESKLMNQQQPQEKKITVAAATPQKKEKKAIINNAPPFFNYGQPLTKNQRTQQKIHSYQQLAQLATTRTWKVPTWLQWTLGGAAVVGIIWYSSKKVKDDCPF